MNPWNRRKHLLVVDFSRGSVKMAEVERAGECLHFHGLTVVPRVRDDGDQTTLNDVEMAQRIAAAVERNSWTGMRTACLLSRSSTSTQTMTFPAMGNGPLRQAIELKLGETLHFSIDEASFDFRKVRETETATHSELLVLVAAARRDAIHQALTTLRQAGLDPIGIGAAAEALANLVRQTHLCGEKEAAIHVDIGSDSTILNLLDGRMLRFSREVDIGGEAFTQALMRPILTEEGAIRLRHDEAEQLKIAAGYPWGEATEELPFDVKAQEILPLLEPVALKLSSEINRSVDYLRGLLKRPSIDRIVLSGPASRMRHLDMVLEENLGVPVLQSDPVARAIADERLMVCDGDGVVSAGFAAVLGYALSSQEAINLIPREDRIELRLARLGRIRKMLVPPAAVASVAAALLAIPIAHTYSGALETMAVTSARIEQQQQEQQTVVDRERRAAQTASKVVQTCGLRPDWCQLMQELAALVPKGVQVTYLTADQTLGRPMIRITASLEARGDPLENVVARFSTALERSPFFTGVKIITASAGGPNLPGRFELTTQIVAGLARPEEEAS